MVGLRAFARPARGLRARRHRIDKTEFLRRAEEGPGVTGVTYDEVDVCPLGEVALVQGVTHYLWGGVPASTRYTEIWQFRGGCWLAVAAQLTRVAGP